MPRFSPLFCMLDYLADSGPCFCIFEILYGHVFGTLCMKLCRILFPCMGDLYDLNGVFVFFHKINKKNEILKYVFLTCGFGALLITLLGWFNWIQNYSLCDIERQLCWMRSCLKRGCGEVLFDSPRKKCTLTWIFVFFLWLGCNFSTDESITMKIMQKVSSDHCFSISDLRVFVGISFFIKSELE